MFEQAIALDAGDGLQITGVLIEKADRECFIGATPTVSRAISGASPGGTASV